jgi:hypothetical protein
VGTPKTCTPSGPCRASSCNPANGDCEETIVPVGTACDPTDSCQVGGQCNDAGECVGAAVPDGTPCQDTSCAAGIEGRCVTGSCSCNDAAPVDLGFDAGHEEAHAGCALGGRPSSSSALFILVVAVGVLGLRRRLGALAKRRNTGLP